MTIEILMPALSPTMTEGNVARWLKNEGDKVEAGDVLAEVETDKATMEVEAVDEGILGKILISGGTQGVLVNTPIAVLLEDGETANDIGPISQAEPVDIPEDAAPTGDNNPVSPETVIVPVYQSPKAEDPSFYEDTVETTVRLALRDAMAEEMRDNDEIYVMGEEVAEYQGAYKVTQGLLQEFGSKRVIDTPITEQGFAGIAVGSAFNGLRPVVEFMTFNFAMQAIDQIINSAAKTLYMSGGQLGCPIVFRGPNGAAARVGAQHSQDYASWYAHVPGLKVVAPWSAADAKGLLKASIRDPNPVVFLENELLYGEKFDVPTSPDYVVPLGCAKVERAGTDVTITAYSIMVGKALKAAEELEKQGISAEVINLRTLRPLDTETIIQSVKKTNRLVSVEEGWAYAGIGSEISAIMMEECFDWLDAPVTRVCAKDVPMPYAANLEKLALPQVEDVVEAVKKVCYK